MVDHAGPLARFSLIVGLLIFGITAVAMAADEKRTAVTANVIAAVIVEAEQVAPGDTVTLLLHQKIRKNWHTYWRNPGDSGQETAVAWTLPDGAHIDPIQWPVPRRIMVGKLANYGYDDEVGLVFDLTIPSTWPVGKSFPVKADAAWLECESICIPSYASFVFSIPTASATRIAKDAAPAFTAARAALPKPTNWRATADEVGDTVVIRVEGLDTHDGQIEAAYLFPAEWGVIDHASDQHLAVVEGGLTLTTGTGDLDVPSTLSGVLVLARRVGSRTVQTGYAIMPAE